MGLLLGKALEPMAPSSCTPEVLEEDRDLGPAPSPHLEVGPPSRAPSAPVLAGVSLMGPDACRLSILGAPDVLSGASLEVPGET